MIPGNLVPITLVPIEVFGAECGYGLCDAVWPYSDCNRAAGHIYRVDDMDSRREEDTIVVYVSADKADWFKKKIGLCQTKSPKCS